MTTPAPRNVKKLILYILICTTYLWEAEAEISIEGTIQGHRSRAVRVHCSFPLSHGVARTLILRRKVFSDTIYRTVTTSKRPEAGYLFRQFHGGGGGGGGSGGGSSSQIPNPSERGAGVGVGGGGSSRWRMKPQSSRPGDDYANGSVSFAFPRASCIDAGLYECRGMFTHVYTLNERDPSIDVARLEMLPGKVVLSSQPKFVDFQHLIPGTLVKLECSVFSTMPMQDNWIWETSRLTNTSWSRVPASAWTVESAPPISKRCYIPWKSTLTLAVSETDIERIYRCYLQYHFLNKTINTSKAVYVFRADHQMPDTTNQVMLTILALFCGSGIVLLGTILMYRSFASRFPEGCPQTVLHLGRVCCRRVPWRRPYSRAHRPRSRRSEHASSHSSPPPASAGGRENALTKPEGPQQENNADTQSAEVLSEKDSPGAEDDSMDADIPWADETVVEVSLESGSPPSPTRDASSLPATAFPRADLPTPGPTLHPVPSPASSVAVKHVAERMSSSAGCLELPSSVVAASSRAVKPSARSLTSSLSREQVTR